MSKVPKKILTLEEVSILRNNPYVRNVSSKGITYTKAFKELFVEEYYEGKTPRQIFRDAGFDVVAIGMDRIRGSAERWRKQAERLEGLKDTRKGGSGRPKTKHLTKDEIIERQKGQIELLKQERDFLLELKRLQRGVIKKGK